MHFVKEFILVVGNNEDEDGDGDVEGSHYDDYGGIMEHSGFLICFIIQEVLQVI